MTNRISIGAIGIILLTLLFSLIYWQYMLVLSDEGGIGMGTISFFAGALSILMMAGCFVLATRLSFVEACFGGLDKVYRVHKYLGIAAVVLLIAHFFSLPGDLEGGFDEESFAQLIEMQSELQDESFLISDDVDFENDDHDDPSYEFLIVPFGIFASCGFMLLITLTLNRKIPYHTWFKTHRLMGILFLFACGHTVFILLEGEVMDTASFPSLFLFITMGLGMHSYIYKEFSYRSKSHSYEIESINQMNRAIEVVLKPLEDRIAFQPGQFAFLSIDEPGFRESHPFTISSSPDDDRVCFVIKSLGDHTPRIRSEAKAGMQVSLRGPHGRFTPGVGINDQVWIAGGIGITPFLSAIRSMDPKISPRITLFYAIRNANDALFLDEIQSCFETSDQMKLFIIKSDDGQRLTIDQIKEHVSDQLNRYDYYLCGPASLVQGMAKGLKNEGAHSSSVHHEEFEIR